jgi:hypothetical protein
VSLSSHSQHFLLSTVEFNIIKNASVSELECRNVKRQSKRRKLNSLNAHMPENGEEEEEEGEVTVACWCAATTLESIFPRIVFRL